MLNFSNVLLYIYLNLDFFLKINYDVDTIKFDKNRINYLNQIQVIIKKLQ